MGKTQRLGLEWPDLRNIQRFVKAHAKSMQPCTLKTIYLYPCFAGFWQQGSKEIWLERRQWSWRFKSRHL